MRACGRDPPSRREFQHDEPGLAALEARAKKKTLHDSQRDTPRVKALRHAFRPRITDELSRLLKHLKFLDESGLHLGMTRMFGRAEPGVRVYETTPD